MYEKVSRRGLIGLAGALVAATALPAHTFAGKPTIAKLFCTKAGRGRNVLLIHGWTSDSHDWSWQLPDLEKRYRTICVDLRGHGRSEVMPSGSYLPAHYVADLEALIASDYSNERFVLVGHSMGAQIAARLAVKRPDLVDAVVSIDGSLGFSADLVPVFQKTARDLAAGDPGVVAPAMFDLFYDPATPLALKRWHARRVAGMPAHVVRESFGPLFLGREQVGVGTQAELFCKQLDVPVYHLCRDAEQAKRMRPWFSKAKSKVDVWRNTGHWIMQDRPDDVNAAVVAWIDDL